MTRTVRLFFLVKFFTEQDHVNWFLDGNLYANRLKYFRELEQSSDIYRPDKHEGVAEWMQPDRVQVVLNGMDISRDLAGPLEVHYNYIDFINVFCLYGGMIREEDLAQISTCELRERLVVPKLCLGMGRHAVLIESTQEFLRRVSEAADKNKYQQWSGAVDYYDPNTFHGTFGQITPIFRKRVEFEHQREFRLALNTRTFDSGPINLFIGDISDIAFQFKPEDINGFIQQSTINLVD